ncbi:MAG: hypothetical protein ABIQ31_27650, partial [Ferruginibacter sp.]
IFISKDTAGFVGNWVEHSSMALKNVVSNDGIINTESFDGRFKSELFYKDGKPIQYTKTTNGITKIITVHYPAANSINNGEGPSSRSNGAGVQMREVDETQTLPPVTVVAYISSAPQSLYSLFYYNPAPSYIYSYVPSAPSGSGGGGTAPSISYTTIVTNAGGNLIGNITDYNKCFDNIPGAGYTYKVTLCVDQPKPGTRNAWGFSGNGTANSSSGSNPVDVGHTFLIFTQTTPTGTTTRNIGFYPRNSASPVSPVDQGQLNNDEQHPYDVSLTITMTNSQFFTVLSTASLGNNAGFQYDLNNNNCSSYALRAVNSAGFNIISTKGTWPGGSGYNPGDLGEDIKAMTLPSNMTKSTIDVSHPNLRSCY